MEVQVPRSFSLARSRSYGKLRPTDLHHTSDEEQPLRRSRTKCFFASLCSILALLALISLAVALAISSRSHSHSSSSSSTANSSTGSAALEAVCATTSLPKLCFDSLSSDPRSLIANPVQLASLAVRLALQHVVNASSLAASLNASHTSLDTLQLGALHDCLQLMSDAHDQLNQTVSNLDSLSVVSIQHSLSDILVQLSASMGFQLACSEGFASQQSDAAFSMLESQSLLSQHLIVSLGLVNVLTKLGRDLSSWKTALPHLLHLRRLLSVDDAFSHGVDDDREATLNQLPLSSVDSSNNDLDFPDWLHVTERKLLQTPMSAVTYDATVAQDGSGKYATIQAALNNVPSKLSRRYVIYVKKGTYSEYLSIPKSRTNLTLLGDGIGSTIITGNRNNKQGFTTFQSATVAIAGPSFIARGITFRNTAGPSGYQAVAVRASGDLTVFDTCSFEGYQDTLYALAYRQFYTNCKIYGTIDFIFGNGIAVFQKCQLLGRQPLQQQSNTFTAQGRQTPSDPSGFSFQSCTLAGDTSLQSSVSNYLGRPWQAYSRTVFLQSYIGSLINPAGWLPWDASNPYTDTVYYGEYGNTGPGSNTNQRVNWKGVHSVLSVQDASLFTVEQFLSGSSWLPYAQVSYQDMLS